MDRIGTFSIIASKVDSSQDFMSAFLINGKKYLRSKFCPFRVDIYGDGGQNVLDRVASLVCVSFAHE